MLHVILWKWKQAGFRDVYSSEYTNIVSSMVRLNLPGVAHRVVCVTDDPEGIDPPTETFPIWGDHNDLLNASGKHLPSCYRRLKLFDRGTQIALGINEGDRIMSLDTDTIILQSFSDIIARIDKSKAVFAGWGVRGLYHQTVFNGSFWTFLAGDHLQEMWSRFDPIRSPHACLKQGFLGSDQAWLSMNFALRKDVLPIRTPEFLSYPREVRRTHSLDRRARIVFFHGSRKPWHPAEYRQQTWITKLWQPPQRQPLQQPIVSGALSAM